MTHVLQPFHLPVIAMAGWLNRYQQAVIGYLIEENRVLKEQLEGQRIRLAVKAKALGRPRVAQEITDFVLRMAGENASWGYDRIQGELTNLGHIIAPNTVKNILKRHGIEQAPERKKRTSWKIFLKAHGDVMAATDFFTVEVWTPRGLMTCYVLFIIHLSTRSAHIAGVTTATAVRS